MALLILRSRRLLPWIDALDPFWATLGLLLIADIPATAIKLVYRRYFAPYEVIGPVRPKAISVSARAEPVIKASSAGAF